MLFQHWLLKLWKNVDWEAWALASTAFAMSKQLKKMFPSLVETERPELLYKYYHKPCGLELSVKGSVRSQMKSARSHFSQGSLTQIHSWNKSLLPSFLLEKSVSTDLEIAGKLKGSFSLYFLLCRWKERMLADITSSICYFAYLKLMRRRCLQAHTQL